MSGKEVDKVEVILEAITKISDDVVKIADVVTKAANDCNVL